DAVLSISRIDTGLERIGQVCPVGGLNPFSMLRSKARASAGVMNNISEPLSNEGYEHGAVDEEPIVVLVRGSKRVGKSTFSRLLLNRLLSQGGGKVAFLELDLGQSEFSPPGSVSLHVFQATSAPNSHRRDGDAWPGILVGPNWCHPRLSVRSHWLGETSPKDDPSLYLLAVEDLMRFYRQEICQDGGDEDGGKRGNRVAKVPLVVNTQGWVKGLGAELSKRVEKLVLPSHILEIEPPSASSLGEVEINGLVGAVDDASLKRLNAADLRTLSIMSFLHSFKLASVRNPSPKWDFDRPTLGLRPFVVDLTKGGLQAGIHILPSGSCVPDELKLLALNGSLVSLFCIDHQDEEEEEEGEKGNKDPCHVWIRSLTRPRPSVSCSESLGFRSLGLGLVRSIDYASSKLHLLTPIPIQDLTHQTRLGIMKGGIELPIWASLDFQSIQEALAGQQQGKEQSQQGTSTLAGVERERVPYLDWPAPALVGGQGQAVVGERKRRVRRNLMRKGQVA
ncbi:hypothetical protein IE53DRAFT_318327, partial [Violaceomyces palustris]